MSVYADRRDNVRVPFTTGACIRAEGQVIPIITEKTKDLSLRGLYCFTDIKYPDGTPCDIELHLTGTTSRLVLNIRGRVVRSDIRGMAMKFDEMDADSFFHLKNVLYYNTGDPELIDRELGSG
ncbi:MAG TPA: PilZ domain-containing protein [Thermodesulfobacteriaceae bacterium]|nr:PilZ domain-containing protein [Thermodesulfobacteriaceae bacterium]